MCSEKIALSTLIVLDSIVSDSCPQFTLEACNTFRGERILFNCCNP